MEKERKDARTSTTGQRRGDEKSPAFKRFEELTRRIVSVPRKEALIVRETPKPKK